MHSPLFVICHSSYILSLLWDTIDIPLGSGVFHPHSPETFFAFTLTRTLQFDDDHNELLLRGACRRAGITFDLFRDHHLRGEVSDTRLRCIQLRLSRASDATIQVDSRDGNQCSEQSALLFVCLPRAPS